MNILFTDLDSLIYEKRGIWRGGGNPRLHTHREWKAAELRIMHIAVVLFTLLSGTLAFTLCACGIVIPFTAGFSSISIIRLSVGIGLAGLAYDLNNLRQIVYKVSNIFEEYITVHRKISQNVIQKWTKEIEQLKIAYKKLYIASAILDFAWPLTTPPPVD